MASYDISKEEEIEECSVRWKVVVTVFWDEKGVIIVNSDHCTEKLSLDARLRPVLRTRIMSEVLFLHGNAGRTRVFSQKRQTNFG